MSVMDLDLYAPDEMTPADFEDDFDLDDDFDEFDLDDEADDWSSSDWWKLANTAVTAADTAYGHWGKDWGSRNKGLNTAILAGLGGLKGLTKGLASYEADPFEPEYEADTVDEMEAMAEDALDGDAMDSALAADEMISRSFGVMRGSPAMRSIMAVLARQVRQIMMAARRNPRLRTVARLAPFALRRTAVALARLAAARRPVNAALAMRIFRSNLARLVRSQRLRAAALRRARMRARRYRSHRGGYRSRPAPRRPAYGAY